MKINFKQRHTTYIILIILIFSNLILTYEEYQKTFINEVNIKTEYHKEQKTFLQETYHSLKKQAQERADRTRDLIRQDLIDTYSSDWSKFNQDFDNLINENNKIAIISNKYITNEKYYYLNYKSDASDMFVASKNGIVSDPSMDCSANGRTRDWDTEISMHFNKVLAKQMIDSLSNSKINDRFWNFANSNKLDSPVYLDMDIEKILDIDNIEDIRDIEFIVVSYIDEYEDITGIKNVNVAGYIADNKRLYVAQGFNLYEQIKNDMVYSANFTAITTHNMMELKSIEYGRNYLSLKMLFSIVTFAIAFISLGLIQNKTIVCYKGLHNNEGDDDSHTH